MFVIIVNQILKMLLLLLLGCLCFRMRLIDENGSKVLANLLLMVVNPMLAIVSLQTEYSAHLAQGLLVAYLLAFLTHLVAAILSTVLIRTTGNPDCGIDRFASMYSNCGFIGIPLVQSILGNEGVLYLTAYMTVFNFFSWTHGIMIMTGTFSLKELKKGLLSPMIFASILGVVFFFGRIHIPYLLIFTTTSTDHALEGFRVRAMHYLVKPYTEEMISDLIDEILARLPSTERYMTLKLNGTEVPLPFSSFIYAEHFSHMIHIHTTQDAVLTVRQSFRDFTAPLKTDERFFLCSRGTVVNLAHAVDFDGTVFQLDDGSRVSVSRDLSKSARQTFMKFLFEKEVRL